jgi:hypothetical protein
MRTWSTRLLRQLFLLALSGLHVFAAATSAAFKSRAALQVRETRALSPGERPASLGGAAQTDVRRSAPLDLAVRSLERLAICLGDCQSRNRHWLAP